ncbi:hypothetical protein GLYMA_18G172950v4 [Glycine max]|nr:hypothetical protein GLYMA_18G172950v4 [Glycine max]KAH1154880.1 hypothetical protein GYH30_050256 [Glycine max]
MGDIYCDVAVAATFRGDIQSARKRENKKGKEGNCHHQMVSDQSYNPLSSTMVLKTTGYVDVEQNKWYGDIVISKFPKLDQTFLFDGLLNDIGRYQLGDIEIAN